MTSPDATPPCPDCRAPLTGASTCRACGLRLTGPAAARLWAVDLALAGLAERREQLLTERSGLLATLRPGTVPTEAVAGAGTSSAGAMSAPGTAGAAVGSNWMSWLPGAGQAGVAAGAGVVAGDEVVAGAGAGRKRREWTPQRVQNTLLGLGALLLTVAGIVFAAVTYDRLGAGGRAAVLVVLTAVAGFTVPQLTRRGLAATAEAVTAVTLVLAALDAYGLRTLGLAEHSPETVYAAGSSLALAVAAGLYATAVPVRLPRFAGVALAHLSVLLLLEHVGHTAGVNGLVLALVAATDLGAWVGLHRLTDGPVRRDIQAAVLTAGISTAVLAGLLATVGTFFSGTAEGALALLVLAATAACAGLVANIAAIRALLTALPAPLTAVAAFAASNDRMTDVHQPLVLAAVAVAAMQVAALLPRAWRTGPVAGALVVATTGVATQLEAAAQAALLPFTWLTAPWTLAAVGDARSALSPDRPWQGTVVTLVVLASAAVAVAGAGLALHRVRTAVIPTAGLLVVSAALLPLGLATSYPLAIVLLLAIAAALMTVGLATSRKDLSIAAVGAGGSVGLLAAVWSTADQSATLLALPVLTALLAGVAVRRPAAIAAATLTGGAALAAAGAAQGLAEDQVGALLLLVAALAIGMTFVLDGIRRPALEAAAAVLAGAAVVLTAGDVGWLSWTLALTGLLALADALHPDRRVVATAGALLLSASSWVRLFDAGISAPEPYVVPLAVLALGLGWLRSRRARRTPSLAAYGPGLSLLLLPSLVASFDDATLTRPLLLGGAALGVLLVGARARLQAPIVFGGAVLAVDALQLLAPYAAALPRWLTLGAAGLLLVAVGATYEQRRRGVARMRQRFEALA